MIRSLAALLALAFLAVSVPGSEAEAAPRLELDFRDGPATWEVGRHSLETGPELSEEERRRIQERLVLRRKMVEVHQTLSFVATGLIVAADVIGMGNHVALEHGDPPRSELEPALAIHRVLAGAAIGTYLGAGLTAWTMPPAWKKARTEPTGPDSGDAHVALSIAHGIGMAMMAGTGFFMANVARGEDWVALQEVHLITGLVTAGLVIAAAITIGSF